MRKKIYGFLLLFAIGVAIYYPYSPGGRQAANMAKARQWVQANDALIHADPRFANIKMGPRTVEGGSLVVGGYVASQEIKDELEKRIAQTNPGVNVLCITRVETPQTSPSASQP